MKLLFFLNMQIFKLHFSGRIKYFQLIWYFIISAGFRKSALLESRIDEFCNTLMNLKMGLLVENCHLYEWGKTVLNNQLFFHRTKRLSFSLIHDPSQSLLESQSIKNLKFWRQKKFAVPKCWVIKMDRI